MDSDQQVVNKNSFSTYEGLKDQNFHSPRNYTPSTATLVLLKGPHHRWSPKRRDSKPEGAESGNRLVLTKYMYSQCQTDKSSWRDTCMARIPNMCGEIRFTEPTLNIQEGREHLLGETLTILEGRADLLGGTINTQEEGAHFLS